MLFHNCKIPFLINIQINKLNFLKRFGRPCPSSNSFPDVVTNVIVFYIDRRTTKMEPVLDDSGLLLTVIVSPRLADLVVVRLPNPYQLVAKGIENESPSIRAVVTLPNMRKFMNKHFLSGRAQRRKVKKRTHVHYPSAVVTVLRRYIFVSSEADGV